MLRKLLVFLFLLLATYPVYKNLLQPGYFPIHDDIQTMRVLEMDKCIKDGQIPCRWVPDMGFGYGYPQFNFYGPLPYYAMEIFHLGGISVIDSVKIGFLLSILISIAGMYLLAESLWGRWGGIISTLFYVYAPYKAVNIYVRGAMGEIWALAVLPFIFWSIREVFRGGKYAILWLSLSVAALLTTHNVSALIFLPFTFIWALWLYISYGKKNLRGIFLGGIWGVLMAAFFIIPVTFERNLVHVDSIIQGYFNYLAHFVGVGQMLFSSFWGYGSSELGDYDDISLSLGLLWILVPIFNLVWLFILQRKEWKSVGLMAALGTIGLFMIHPKSVFIWQQVQIMEYIQFPWRFFGVAVFMFSLAAGSLVLLIGNKIKYYTAVVIAVLLTVILFNSSYFRPQKQLFINDNDKFSGDSWTKQQTISIFDYLPVSANLPPTKPAAVPFKILSGDVVTDFYKLGTNWAVWKVNVKSDFVRLKLPIMYFPNWELFDNGRQSAFDYKNSDGAITLTLDKGEHVVYAKLSDTYVRKMSNFISAFALLCIPLYLKKRVNEKL